MGGRFKNTTYATTVDSLHSTMKKVIKNNYYKYSDKAPTPVDYFHINKEASMLDEGSQLAFENVGPESPLRYNRIQNMMIYGLEQFIMQYQSDDFGTESVSIEGEVFTLPNTIEPYPDDQFIINYLEKDIIFKITEVTPDTVENGANLYRVAFRSSTSTKNDLIKQTIEDYTFIINNVGTELNPILKSNVIDYLESLDQTIITLKKYFKRLFYNKRVQTFTYSFLDKNFYDPYMIEFLKRNKILENDGEYIYIQHQTNLDVMFPMLYRKTFFYCLEEKDVSHIEQYKQYGAGRLIENNTLIFSNRMEEYYEVFYDYPEGYEYLTLIPTYKKEFFGHISDCELLESKTMSFYNIVIKYLYDKDIYEKDIKELDYIEYDQSPMLFYALPCIIYCLEKFIDKMIRIGKTSK